MGDLPGGATADSTEVSHEFSSIGSYICLCLIFPPPFNQYWRLNLGLSSGLGVLYHQSGSLCDSRANSCIRCDCLSTMSVFAFPGSDTGSAVLVCVASHPSAGPGKTGCQSVVTRAWAVYSLCKAWDVSLPGRASVSIATLLAFCIAGMFLSSRFGATFRSPAAADLDLPRALAGAWFCQLQISFCNV